MKNYHVTKDGDQWKFKGEGAQRATLVDNTKAGLINQVREHMIDREGSVKIHKEDGTFQEERTYPGSADPHKSKG